MHDTSLILSLKSIVNNGILLFNDYPCYPIFIAFNNDCTRQVLILSTLG